MVGGNNYKYRHFAKIERKSVSQGAGGTPIESWVSVISSMRVERRMKSTRNIYQDGTIVDLQDVRFYFRNPGEGVIITPGMRLTLTNDHSGQDDEYIIENVNVPNRPKFDIWEITGKQQIPGVCS
jgi:hypothetical protein